MKGNPQSGSRGGSERLELTAAAPAGGHPVVRRDPQLEQSIRLRLPNFLREGPGSPSASVPAVFALASWMLLRD